MNVFVCYCFHGRRSRLTHRSAKDFKAKGDRRGLPSCTNKVNESAEDRN